MSGRRRKAIRAGLIGTVTKRAMHRAKKMRTFGRRPGTTRHTRRGTPQNIRLEAQS